MSTKNTTTGSTGFNFDAGSMAAYQKNIGTTMPFLRSNVTNPYGSDAFKQESTANQQQATQMGQRGVSNVTNNAAAMGYSTNGGMFNSMLQRAGQATGSLQAQGFRSAVGNANTRQMASAQMLNSFQPLMTGSNSTSVQQQSGLGTWLPQLAGAALGAAGSFAAAGGKAGVTDMSGQGTANTITGGSSPFPGSGGVMGAFPGMGGGGNGLPNMSGSGFPSIASGGGFPSFYGNGYGYR